jgi:hypothetical protein
MTSKSDPLIGKCYKHKNSQSFVRIADRIKTLHHGQVYIGEWINVSKEKNGMMSMSVSVAQVDVRGMIPRGWKEVNQEQYNKAFEKYSTAQIVL